ncbi:MAG: hypothetical protein OEO19_05865 [Gammaproteobacteria bacterium]|nr:hypothetical protein [Gammaproteobacteria bacterium]MDH3447318.1 hypothetical protein [Gammaproteobacteria bacterium]
MKSLIVLFVSLVTAACATGYHPVYRFNEILVVNLSGATILDVDVRIAESPRTLQCQSVAQNAMCYDRFGSRNYPQRGIELGWTPADGSAKRETVNPRIPAFFMAAFPLRIVIEIRDDGSVNAFYEQEEPGRNGGIFISG